MQTVSRHPMDPSYAFVHDPKTFVTAFTDVSDTGTEQCDKSLHFIVDGVQSGSFVAMFCMSMLHNGILYSRNISTEGPQFFLVLLHHPRLVVLEKLQYARTLGNFGVLCTDDRVCRRFFWMGLYNSSSRRNLVPLPPVGQLHPFEIPLRHSVASAVMCLVLS